MSEELETPPAWLPELLDVNGEPQQVFEALYQVFRLDFVDAPSRFRRCPVWFDRKILPDDDKEEGFWHLVTRDDYGVGARLLDPRRAERLAWCGATLRFENEPELVVWDYLEGKGKCHTYLWLRDWDYVVILHRRTLTNRKTGQEFDVFHLVTAFYVDKRKRADLEGRYRRRVT